MKTVSITLYRAAAPHWHYIIANADSTNVAAAAGFVVVVAAFRFFTLVILFTYCWFLALEKLTNSKMKTSGKKAKILRKTKKFHCDACCIAKTSYHQQLCVLPEKSLV